MTFKEITLELESVDWQRVLTDWAWLLEDHLELNVWFLTRFADLFVYLDDDSVWRLDTGAGTFECIASNRRAFADLMDVSENVELWFMPRLIEELESQEKWLQPGQCYGFITPTGFREGGYVPENVKMVDIGAYFKAMGNLWERLKDVPDGQRVKLQLNE
jgi:hypothetical protein